MSDHRPPNFADPRNVIDPGRKDSLATWMAFYGMLEDTTDRYTTRSDWAKAPADEAFIHAAIRLRALSAASVPLRVYVRSGHDLTPADLTEDKDAKELQELLDFVNPDTMSSSDLKATLVSSLSIYGEAYLLKTRGRLGGRPKELHFLNPAAVTPKMGDRWIDEYVYQPIGRQQTATYDPKDVIAFRVPGNFIDPTRGLSPINAVRMEIGTSRMATEHTNSQLRNQGVPAGVWVAPKDSEITTQDQSTIKRVLASLRGPKNAGKTAVLPGGLEWRSLGFSEKDAQYLMARKVSRMAIGAALGVPLALLGDDEHTGVYRSTRDAEQVFWRRLTEELNWMAQIIDSWLTSEYDKTGQRLTVRFDTSAVEALRPTIMEQSSLWQMMLSMGIVTTNEARAHFGVGAPVEWGNVPVRSGGLAPIGTDGMPVMPAAPAAPGAPAPEGPKPAEGKEPAVIDAMTPEDESDDPEVQPLTLTVSSWQGFGGSSQSGLPKGKKHGDHDQTTHGNRDGAVGGGSDSSPSPTSGLRGSAMGYRATTAIEANGGRVQSLSFASNPQDIEALSEQIESAYVGMLGDYDETDDLNLGDKDERIADGLEHMGQALMLLDTSHSARDEGDLVTIVRDKNGNIAGAASSTIGEHPDGYEVVTLTVLGTNGLVAGAGSALIARLIGEAFENDQGFAVQAAELQAFEFYERLGLGERQNTSANSANFLLTPDQVGEWIASYVAEEEGM